MNQKITRRSFIKKTALLTGGLIVSGYGCTGKDPSALLDTPGEESSTVIADLVVVGGKSQVWLSTFDSPENWTNAGYSGEDLMAVAYGNNRFVAVGDYGKIQWSDDGHIWYDNSFPLPATTNERFYAIGFGNGRFVALTRNNQTRWCTDGTDWSTSITIPGTAVGYYGIHYANGIFVAAGDNRSIHWCTDGTDWSSNVSTCNLCSGSCTGINEYYGVAYGNGRYVAVGDNGEAVWSTDMTDWSAVCVVTGGGDHLRGIAYGNGRFVAVGVDGVAYWCTDGTDWSANVGPSIDHLYDITYANNRFYTVGEKGSAYWSSDGTSWTDISPGGNAMDEPLFGITFRQ